jgi:hypothetical protein
MSHPSNTPETDYQAVNVIGFYSCATVPADFARQLERERNEAQADRAHLLLIARDRLEKIRQLEREIEAATSLKSQISNLQSNP